MRKLFPNYALALLLLTAVVACEPDSPPIVEPPIIEPPVAPPVEPPLTPSDAQPVFVDGVAQVVPGFADTAKWVRQELWVETPFDSDGDGRPDRMHVDVTRPQQTQTGGLKVPVVYASSPYFAAIAPGFSYDWNVMHEIGAVPPPRAPAPTIPFVWPRPRISNSEVNTWVPRGFAVVHSEAPGTGLSQGCVSIGGETEALAPKAVIDWLNGRAKGYTTIDGYDTVTAAWSTGKVGMVGTSYDGTLAIAAATTGVQGLEAIIPVSPLVSYYHYYRANGLVRSPGGFLGEDADVLYDFVNSGDLARRGFCNATARDGLLTLNQDRITGDYSAFWRSRDMMKDAGRIRAATLLAHGFNDWNVMPAHSVSLYEALKNQSVPRMLFLHQNQHGFQPPLDLRLRWFTRFLYGVPNGVENGARAYIGRENAATIAYPDYPNPAAAPVKLQPYPGGHTIGALTLDASGQGIEIVWDNVGFPGRSLADMTSQSRLLYATAELRSPVHLSGWTRVDIRMSASKPAANLSVWLVALPIRVGNQTQNVITRGWADPQNHASLTGATTHYDALTSGTPLAPGQFYSFAFYLEPDDQIVPAGKRLGIMIMSSDREFTLWPQPGTILSVDLSATSVTLPVVGGRAALEAALQQ